MAELKREYVVPLRRKTIPAPKWRRSKRAVSVLREFMRKHMKADNVVVCQELNEHLWENGAKKPPGKVSVVAGRVDVDGEKRVIVNLKEYGIDQQLSLYEQPAAATESSEGAEGVVDTEATEKESSSQEETQAEESSQVEETKEVEEEKKNE